MMRQQLAWATFATALLCSSFDKTWSAESKPDANRLITFEDFAKDYRCPDWFRNAKFGLWAHWGPQSMPRLGGGWYARHMYMPDVVGEQFGKRAYPFHIETYGHPAEFGFKDVINLWKAEKSDADALTAFFKKCGARYVVGLANHHDHFDCFASTHHPWADLLYYDGHDFSYGEHGKRVVERLYNDSFRRHGSVQAVCTIKSCRPGWVWDIEKGGSDRLESEPWQTDTTLGAHWF